MEEKTLKLNFNELQNLIDSIPEKVSEQELATVAFTGDYNDLVTDQLSYMKKLNLTKINDFLYTSQYSLSESDYIFAKDYFINNHQAHPACSGVINGNWFGRNYDWYYNHDADMIVLTKGNEKYFSSIGVASCMPFFTDEFASSNAYSDYYKMIPFYVIDGINEKGVVCSVNVVPRTQLETTGTNPSSETSLCEVMLIRYILDNAKSAKDAIDKLESINIYGIDKNKFEYDFHYMIADSTDRFVVEFTNNVMYVIDYSTGDVRNCKTNLVSNNLNLAGKPWMTNFRNMHAKFSSSGNLDYDAIDVVEPLGSGLERWELIKNNYNSANTKEGMKQLMKKLSYSNAYPTGREENLATDQPFWYTEFVGITSGDKILTVADAKNNKNLYEDKFDIIDGLYINQSRDTQHTWQTTHSTIYDIENKKMTILVQEGKLDNNTYYEFSLDEPYTTNVTSISVVSELPELPNPTILYLIKNNNTITLAYIGNIPILL